MVRQQRAPEATSPLRGIRTSPRLPTSSVYTLTSKLANKASSSTHRAISRASKTPTTRRRHLPTPADASRRSQIRSAVPRRSRTRAISSDTVTDIASRVTDVTISSGKLTQSTCPTLTEAGVDFPQWKYTYDGTTGLATADRCSEQRHYLLVQQHEPTSRRLITYPGGSIPPAFAHLPFGLKTGTSNSIVKIEDVKPYFVDQPRQYLVFPVGSIRERPPTKDVYDAINTWYLDPNGLIYKRKRPIRMERELKPVRPLSTATTAKVTYSRSSIPTAPRKATHTTRLCTKFSPKPMNSAASPR